jgi:hypothetical protein
MFINTRSYEHKDKLWVTRTGYAYIAATILSPTLEIIK